MNKGVGGFDSLPAWGKICIWDVAEKEKIEKMAEDENKNRKRQKMEK